MIYIVRHGQTEYNINGRFGGRLDVHLNETGIKDAYLVKEKLKDIKFYRVYSSPLIRAIDTAKIITDHPITIDERLIERSNGDLEGKLKSEIKDIIDFNSVGDNKYHIEPIDEFRHRINSFFDEITKINENILVVTHAGVIIYARCYFEGEPKDHNYLGYKVKNGEILKYERRDYGNKRD